MATDAIPSYFFLLGLLLGRGGDLKAVATAGTEQPCKIVSVPHAGSSQPCAGTAPWHNTLGVG